MRILSAAFGVLIVAAAVSNAAPSPLKLQDRWIYVPTSLESDANVQTVLALLERGAKDGYTGIVLDDPGFVHWDTVGPGFAGNARKVRDACRQLKLAFIPTVFDIGASERLLARDPNLAAGLPVMDAPFIVRNGTLVPAEDPTRLLNGSFEEHQGNEPAGWTVDLPGKVCFMDSEVKYEGKPSLRMQDIGQGGTRRGRCSATQPLKLRPFTYYHVSAAVKTQDFGAANTVRIEVESVPRHLTLNYYEPPVRETQDWRRVDVVFNSLEFSEATLYLVARGGRSTSGGKIWWADARIEPAGLVNVLRRDGTPVRVTSEDGKTQYKEGQDFGPVSDPKLGKDPGLGVYTPWHEPPVVPVPAGSALKEGQRVLISYYHPTIVHRYQVAICMAEPKLYDLLKWQADEVRKNLDPDGYFMNHDEIRCEGWDEACARMKMTPGQLLAYNMKRCVEILNTADPGKPMYVWSDMFDPYHNALKTGRYYLVKGEGPWYGSWEGLPKEVVVVNWHGHEPGRVESLKFFADRGHKQILAGYYDADPTRILPWLVDAAKVEGVVGVMYTTWRQNYSDLEKFAEKLGSPSASPAGATQ